ncbi:Aste57867_2711 [Aphanomyces stellatus]|uniref:Aste57867_2711 protein n=1 Tax=Aphanomyces stellatus TaxID=120398 RepID=A0A485KAN6_9STRA|nr:hypothetical protein As57867_002704 [Aphanomyces stellatus]VFT79904.1 Aste57867_2711 [Aphanomyces stellatus]
MDLVIRFFQHMLFQAKFQPTFCRRQLMSRNIGVDGPRQCHEGEDMSKNGSMCSPKCRGKAPVACGSLFCASSGDVCAYAAVQVEGFGVKVALSAIAPEFTGVIKASVELGTSTVRIRSCA